MLKNTNYNLFRLSKLPNSKRKMHDNVSKVEMVFRSKVLIFDMVLKTTKFTLFCTNLRHHGLCWR